MDLEEKSAQIRAKKQLPRRFDIQDRNGDTVVIADQEGLTVNRSLKQLARGGFNPDVERPVECSPKLQSYINTLQERWTGNIKTSEDRGTDDKHLKRHHSGFKLEREFVDNQLRKLVLPLPDEDIDILEVHDDHGEFVAESVLDQLEEKITHLKRNPVYVRYDLESLYVEIEETTVEQKIITDVEKTTARITLFIYIFCIVPILAYTNFPIFMIQNPIVYPFVLLALYLQFKVAYVFGYLLNVFSEDEITPIYKEVEL